MTYTLAQLQALAANQISCTNPAYDSATFLADFPQFTGTPAAVLTTFISMASVALPYDAWAESWQYAMGLYVAHYSTMYLKDYSTPADGTTPTAADAADTAGGSPEGVVSSSSFDGISVSMSHEGLIKAEWGMWNATNYGRQLTGMAKLLGLGGAYII